MHSRSRPAPHQATAFAGGRRRFCSLLLLGAASLGLRPRLLAQPAAASTAEDGRIAVSSTSEGLHFIEAAACGQMENGKHKTTLFTRARLRSATANIQPGSARLDEALLAIANRHPERERLTAEMSYLSWEMISLLPDSEFSATYGTGSSLILSLPPYVDEQKKPQARVLGLVRVGDAVVAQPILFKRDPKPFEKTLPDYLLVRAGRAASNPPPPLAWVLPKEFQTLLLTEKKTLRIELHPVADDVPDDIALIRHARARQPLGTVRLSLDEPWFEAGQQLVARHSEIALKTLREGRGSPPTGLEKELYDELTKPSIPGGAVCFLTTAACEVVGLPDDCWELRTLRRFRDRAMPRLPSGAEDIARYYREAPAIVAALRRRADAPRAFLALYWRWIIPCALLAALGADRLCHRAYRAMMRRLATAHPVT
jgi:hypothetical protein